MSETPNQTPLDLPKASTRRRSDPSAAGSGSSAPTTIAEGRARLKRRRLTGQERKDVVAMARGMTGYGPSSPIWGKRMPVVLAEVLEHLDKLAKTSPMTTGQGKELDAARILVEELQKRIATGQIVGANS